MGKFVLIILATFVAILNASPLKHSQIRQEENLDWWQNAVVYQIYPRSFRDSNNDGVGDLRGIIEKIDHLIDLEVDAIWLSPIYKSPMIDNGYDISDYRTIDEVFGNMDDFMELLDKYHKAGIKVLLDFVPNHTSDQHEWFNKSVSKEPGYEDYYIWAAPKLNENGTRSPPNNWLSVFDNSAWTWNEQRQEYYFHQFYSAQPDLNFRNAKVQQELKDVMAYWLDMGVDGFRIDAVPHIYEDAELKDEPVNPDSGLNPTDYNYLNHIYTKDQNETFSLVYDWRAFMDNYTKANGGDTRIFMTECASDLDKILYYYGNGEKLGAHFSFNFNLLGLDVNSTSKDINDKIDPWFDRKFNNYTKNWLTGNHDNPRAASRMGPNHVDAYNMLITILGGVTVTYMGEEIGQENGELTPEEMTDARNLERTPFQWDTTVNAGFNDGATPWLPVSKKYLETNLADQKNKTISHYKNYKQLVQLKKDLVNYSSLGYGYDEIGNVFVVSRTNGRSQYYRYIFNIGREGYEIKLGSSSLFVQSVNVSYSPGDTLVLQPGDSIILKA
ncbi:maltase 1-like [Anthonomus grandis grandis]|uniref:maltase 1-like n=1 Tax=Anthonomus grandis grandis TaxID=2921223 RepID=UPI002165606D|nr:maltase 1-like [Anthonomus grandis grandis]